MFPEMGLLLGGKVGRGCWGWDPPGAGTPPATPARGHGAVGGGPEEARGMLRGWSPSAAEGGWGCGGCSGRGL